MKNYLNSFIIRRDQNRNPEIILASVSLIVVVLKT